MTLLALLEHLPQLTSRDRASDLLLYNHHEGSINIKHPIPSASCALSLSRG
ncbi:hypothetical protein FOXYSP1_00306 [Fusarium oxysporum f. sp. phaseoli]